VILEDLAAVTQAMAFFDPVNNGDRLVVEPEEDFLLAGFGEAAAVSANDFRVIPLALFHQAIPLRKLLVIEGMDIFWGRLWKYVEHLAVGQRKA
jgi:hypothetical protein